MRALRLLLVSMIACGAARADGTRWLHLVGTADRHGHLEAERQELVLDGGRRVTVERGGAAWLGGYLANLRRAAPGAVVLLDSGDLFQGTLVSNLGEGEAVVAAMNALGYAASALGNHEFDFGPVGPHATVKSPAEDPRGALRARAHDAKFALVSANVVEGERPLFASYVLVEAAGTRVAIIGGTSEDLPRTTIRPNLAGLTVRPLAESIAHAARDARRAGAQVVVAVVHAGGGCGWRAAPLTDASPGDLAGCERESELFRLARELESRASSGDGGRVDALFGGHTHQFLTAVVGHTPVVQAPPSGLGLGEIDLELAADGKPTGRFRVPPLVELCSATAGGTCDAHRAHGATVEPAQFAGAPVAPDEKLAAVLAPHVARAQAARARAVGVELDGKLERHYTAESPLGNLVADLVRAATHTDVAFVNGGGLRADLPAGALTYGVLFEALPFDNRLATVRMTGAQLRALLGRNLGTARGVLSIGGARVEARCRAGGLDVVIALADGRRVEDAGHYTVGTTDFLALGGDDFGELPVAADTVKVDEDAILRDVVAAGLGKLGPVLHAGDPRWFDPAHRRLDLPRARPVGCPR